MITVICVHDFYILRPNYCILKFTTCHNEIRMDRYHLLVTI